MDLWTDATRAIDVYHPDAVALAERLGVELNHYHHAKTDCLAPVNTNRDGVFVCGAFQEPKDIPLSVMEASASATAATGLLADSRWTQTRVSGPRLWLTPSS